MTCVLARFHRRSFSRGPGTISGNQSHTCVTKGVGTVQPKCLLDVQTAYEPRIFSMLELGGLCPSIFVTFWNQQSNEQAQKCAEVIGVWISELFTQLFLLLF